MRTELSIKREYGRANRELRSKRVGSNDNVTELRGVRQALAWVLEDNAMAPVRCAVPIKRKAKTQKLRAKG